MRRLVHRLRGVAMLAAGLCCSGVAAAYPTRTVEIIVSYGAGGSTDFVARAVAQKLFRKTRPGLRRAEPPGRQRHHRHQHGDARRSPTATRSISATRRKPWWCRRLSKTATYSVVDDFEPIAITGLVPVVLVVSKTIKADNLQASSPNSAPIRASTPTAAASAARRISWAPG